jgi:hypothetical protein
MARQLYTEKGDKKADAPLMRSLTAAQKKAFEVADKKHPKKKYQDQDTKVDKKIIKQIKKKVK